MNEESSLWAKLQSARKRYDWTAYYKYLHDYCVLQINTRKKIIDNTIN